MRKYLLVIISVLSFSTAAAQGSFNEFIDSAIKRSAFSTTDWAIGLNIAQAGRVPLFDSLGNQEINPAEDCDCTIFILKIRGKYFAQRFTFHYGDHNESVFHASTLKALPKEITINYNVDSIALAEKEYLLPFIYKLQGSDYYNYQEPAGHSAYYTMYFITKQVNALQYFNADNISEEIPFPDSQIKNVNYSYNSKTFTLRAFVKLKKVIDGHKEIFMF